MPRGKNYVNNNKGMTMQAPKKKGPSMEQCFYGAGCIRKDCIYRHDGPAKGDGSGDKSNEPCMPFLAGLCTFSAKGCRKRHPNKEEAERLIAKYKTTKCRYGDHCKTTGCLYIHSKDGTSLGGSAFPPLAGNNETPPKPVVPTGAWKPMHPTGAAVVSPNLPAQQRAQASPSPRAVSAAQSIRAAWGAPQQASVWGPPRGAAFAMNSNGSNGHSFPPNVSVNDSLSKPAPAPMSFAAAATIGQQQPLPAAETSLNIHAKEFVPGAINGS